MYHKGIISIEDTDKVFVTSDHHFGHENIIKFTNRPFETVEDMDEKLIENWNEVVGVDDRVIHLGDFTLGDFKVAHKYLSQLNGHLSFLCTYWHHDKRWLPSDTRELVTSKDHIITWLPPMAALEIPKWGKDRFPLAVSLCHYPLAEWDRKGYGAWHLHGHSHGNYQASGFILDVGVDCTNYYPLKLSDVLERDIYGLEITLIPDRQAE